MAHAQIGIFAAMHKAWRELSASIDSKLHLPCGWNPIILACKAGADPVGASYQM